jgi:hypothetical protein
MKVVSFNCYNFKSNQLMVKKLMKNFDICYFCEHWLGNSEGYLFNDICENQSSIFSADFENCEYDFKSKKGRPFGGRCWIINDKIPIKEYEVLNKAVSRLTVIGDDGNEVIIYGIWQPYDDGTVEKLGFFHSTIAMLESDVKEFSGNSILIMGDFNSDLNRNKRFDSLLRKFIKRSGLSVMSQVFSKDKIPTYKKGDYRATLDHILGNEVIMKYITNFEVISESENLSDHQPVSCCFDSNMISNNSESGLNFRVEEKRFYRFPWSNLSFLDLYINDVDKNCENLYKELYKLTHDEIIFDFCEKLRKLLLKAARNAELNLGLSTSNGVKKGSVIICNNNKEIISIMKNLKMMKINGDLDSENAKVLKKELRKLQRRSCYNRSKNESLKLSNLLNYNRDMFWKRVNSFKKKCKKKAKISSEKPNLSKFMKFYEGLFSHEDRPSDENHLKIEQEVRDYADLCNNVNMSIGFTDETINDAIDKLKVGKAPGFDNIPNEFFKMANCDNFRKLLKLFFDTMGKSGKFPPDFNTAILTPIPKSEKLVEPSDYRPISVSTPLATLFETMLLGKLDCLMNLSPNQFGYAKKTSCKNAFFIANEVLSYYETGGSNCHVISLDAAKAFDKMWREGLFFKLKRDTEPATWRLLYNYYKISQVMVKVDGQVSETFRTTQGVKQGGILSPFLFNYFMDGLLRDCCALGVGALLGKNNVSVLAYCDDLLLLSPVRNHMDKLLKTCFTFAKSWKVKFNAKKSISFSLKRPMGTYFSVEGNKVPVADEGFVYLGMPIGNNVFTLNHFEGKFLKVEKAFYSLRGLGCRSGLLDPKSIGFIYKQYCQSICKYGLECLTLNEKFLNELNIRQNILLKGAIGLSFRCKSKPLLQCLDIEQIPRI